MSEFHDDYQQGTGPDTVNYWCISIGTSLFTWRLYVALLRGVSQGSTYVLCKPSKEVDHKGNSTQNLVYTDVLGT
jgi:hypothetical protein